MPCKPIPKLAYAPACGCKLKAREVQMKNVRIDSAEGVKHHALNIYQQSVVTRQMPMNNATGITEDERQLIKRWYEAGASVQ